ncbi:TonB-dependent receptor [Sphingorhabdus sp. IMCC26285]|uniref:TonB-dependent receptor n=1 Tax=Sphingorhabdus profundilacus TaxID=2509718 RepID=A0A6I4LTA7_9SPHN|nr:TonB-dependent receptor [Sphingorhabdus profundilacus]MVZ96687.1 TonB-dependent receptor [Sphingorhabdus profundilacus]
MTYASRPFALLITAAGYLLSSPALQAEEVEKSSSVLTQAEGKRQFRGDFFAMYSPVTALDMVRRIPGFSIDDGNGRRGFGENAGNVLIDGDRPSSKADDIFTILARIPASEVAYIELTEQAGADSEAQGKGQIVNVIRKVSEKISGTYEGNIVAGTRYGFQPSINASATLRRNRTTIELNVSSYSERIYGFGPEDFRTGSGAFVERRHYQGNGGFDEAAIGGSIKTRLGAAKVNLNGQVRFEDSFDRREGSYFSSAGLDIGSELLLRDGPINDLGYEFGGDVEFGLGPQFNTKIIGLYRNARESNDSSIAVDRRGQPLTRFETRSRNQPSEAVARIQNDVNAVKGHAIQFGGEVAYNRLDAKFSAASSVAGAVTSFPASNVLVEEVRIEPFVTDIWAVGPSWKIEVGAIAEFSKLTLSGDSLASRQFKFLKPRAAATWTVDSQTTFEFRAERQVEQLDFEEFATSLDVGLGNQVDAGNADLVPEKTTTFSALVRHKFLDRGSIQFRGDYQLVSDTQDLVPITLRDAAGNITAQFDGAGNIGDSKRWNGELEITLPFDWLTKPFGVSGIEVKYVGHYHDSRVTDPVTGQKRRRSNRSLWHQQWDLRYDVSQLGIVYGASFYVEGANNSFFLDEFRRQSEGIKTNIFIEYTKLKLGTLRLQVIDLSDFRRDRFIFNDTRASGVLREIINRKRSLDPLIQLTLSGKF